MWAFLVLTFAVAAGASETADNRTAAEEKPLIARGKLLVSLRGGGGGAWVQALLMAVTPWLWSLQAPSVVG